MMRLQFLNAHCMISNLCKVPITAKVKDIYVSEFQPCTIVHKFVSNGCNVKTTADTAFFRGKLDFTADQCKPVFYLSNDLNVISVKPFDRRARIGHSVDLVPHKLLGTCLSETVLKRSSGRAAYGNSKKKKQVLQHEVSIAYER